MPQTLISGGRTLAQQQQMLFQQDRKQLRVLLLLGTTQKLAPADQKWSGQRESCRVLTNTSSGVPRLWASSAYFSTLAQDKNCQKGGLHAAASTKAGQDVCLHLYERLFMTVAVCGSVNVYGVCRTV